MYSASICFPLPLSPVRRMVAFPCAARDATSSRSVIDGAVLSTIPFVSPIWSASACFIGQVPPMPDPLGQRPPDRIIVVDNQDVGLHDPSLTILAIREADKRTSRRLRGDSPR